MSMRGIRGNDNKIDTTVDRGDDGLITATDIDTTVNKRGLDVVIQEDFATEKETTVLLSSILTELRTMNFHLQQMTDEYIHPGDAD